MRGGRRQLRVRFILCSAGIGTSGWEWWPRCFLLWWFRALARRRSQTVLAHVAERLVYYGVFQLAVSLIILLPARLERFVR